MAIFLRFILPIIIVIALCITSYFVFAHGEDKVLEAMHDSTESRISEIKQSQYDIYKSQVAEIENDKITNYILLFGMFSILCLFGFHLLRLLLNVDNKFLLYPNKYKVIPVEEADCIRYLKDKFMEAEVIKGNELLEKKHVMKHLTQNVPPTNK